MNGRRAREKKGGSFRARLVLLSILVSAAGLLGFALLSLGFQYRQDRASLEENLSRVLAQTAPVLLHVARGSESPGAERLAGRILGRLEEFGAVYAIRTGPDRGWEFGPGWPAARADFSDDLILLLPDSSRQVRGQGRFDVDPRRFRERAGGPETPALPRRNVRLLPETGIPAGWLVAGIRYGESVALLAVPESLARAQTRRLAAVLLLASPVALGLVGVGAFLLAGRATAPVRRLSEVAAHTTGEDLSHRIPPEGLDREFFELAEVFNGMLARIETSLRQARRFGQDAAHELNTPLTVLTNRIEEALATASDGSNEQAMLAESADELARLREIVRKLHLLARIDGGALRAEATPVDLARLTKETVDEVKEAFPGIHFAFSGPSELVFPVDPTLVRQILLNLLGNAATYNRPGGEVGVELVEEPKASRLAVTNTGEAVPAQIADAIFDRFFRGDASRSREDGGLGLGLSLAREFARAHGGDLVLAENLPDRIRFVLTLPRG